MVFYTGEQRWDVPIGLETLMDLPAELQRFVPRWETLFLPLHQTPAEALTQFATAIGWALRVWQAERVPVGEMQRVLTEAMRGLEGLTEAQAGQWARVATFFLQLIFHRREERELINLVLEQARQSKFREEEEVTTLGMTLAEAAETRGQEQELRAALKTVLASRFGALPVEIEAAVDAASVTTMRAWLPLAATARTLAETGIPPAEPQR